MTSCSIYLFIYFLLSRLPKCGRIWKVCCQLLFLRAEKWSWMEDMWVCCLMTGHFKRNYLFRAKIETRGINDEGCFTLGARLTPKSNSFAECKYSHAKSAVKGGLGYSSCVLGQGMHDVWKQLCLCMVHVLPRPLSSKQEVCKCRIWLTLKFKPQRVFIL